MQSLNYFKENAADISKRIKEELKSQKFKQKEFSKMVNMSYDNFNRKLNNKNDAYFKSNDIKIIAKALNISFEKLIYNECYLKSGANNKAILKRDYIYITNYLHSIGIHVEPGLFWHGSGQAFINAKKDLMPILSDSSKSFYKANKKSIDAFEFENDLILSLKKNPFENARINIDDIQFKNKNEIGFIGFLNRENGKTLKDIIKCGFVEYRFYINFDNYKTDKIKTISVNDAYKLFEFLDNMTENAVKSLLSANLSDYNEI